MSSLNTIRLADGTELQLSEWLHWPLYSVIEFAVSDAISLDAFSYNVGATVPHSGTIAARQATEADTNQVRAGKMNQDEAQVVFAITYEVFGLTTAVSNDSPSLPLAPEPLTSANVLRLLQLGLIVELKVGANIKKPQIGVPFSYIGQGIGQSMYASGDFVALHIGQGGCPTPLNQRKLNLPVYIGGFGQNAKPGNAMAFFLRTRTPNGAVTTNNEQSIRLRWWLDGLKKRPA
jgi:hypothetical protein